MIGVSAKAITSANFLLIQGKMKSTIAHSIQKDDRTSTNFKQRRAGCPSHNIECRDGQDARPTRIVEKLTVQLDAQQLIKNLTIIHTFGRATEQADSTQK